MLRSALLIAGNGLLAGTLGILIYGISRIKSSPILGIVGASYIAAALLSGQSAYVGVGTSLLVASYVAAFPPGMHTFLPALVLLPLALLTILGLIFRQNEPTLRHGRALTVVAHLTAAFLLATVLLPKVGASARVSLWAVLGGVLIYSYPGLIRKEGDHLLGFVLLSVVFCQRIFLQSGFSRIPILLSLLLVPILIAIYAIHPRNKRLAGWLDASLISVSLILSIYVTFQRDTVTSSAVLAICAFCYAIMGFLIKRDEYIYLLTLAVGLFAFNIVMASADLFSWQLASIFMYIILGIGFVILGLLFATVFRYKRPFSLLIAKNVTGAVILSAPVILFALIALGSYTLRATENPLFCATCHNMQNQFIAWRNSAHSHVTCVACHRTRGPSGFVEEKMTGIVEGMKYVSGEYREKSHSQVADESCTSKDCHSKESLTGRKTLKEGIGFNHEIHIEGSIYGLSLRCNSCHSHVTEQEHFSVNETVCYQCHLYERGESGTAFGSCITCHELPKKQVGSGDVRFTHKDVLAAGTNVRCVYCHSDVTAGSGEVVAQACQLCHTETTIERAEESDMHQAHVTEFKVECIQCHSAIEHGEQIAHIAGIEPPSGICSSCHMVKHSTAMLIYSGKALKNAQGRPDPMYEAGVKCNGCHRFESGKMVSGLASCDHCHGEGSGYSDLVVNWQSDISKQAAKTEKLIQDAQSAFSSVPKGDIRIKKLIDYARSAHTAVVTDGSMGAHNYDYSSWLLESARDSVEAAVRMLREGT